MNVLVNIRVTLAIVLSSYIGMNYNQIGIYFGKKWILIMV